jgi:hypothetical protein
MFRTNGGKRIGKKEACHLGKQVKNGKVPGSIKVGRFLDAQLAPLVPFKRHFNQINSFKVNRRFKYEIGD